MKIMNSLRLALVMMICCRSISAQVPYVKSINKSSARPQEAIDIQGINFGTNTANIRVQFGNVLAVPQKMTDQFIEVNVPYGVTYENVNVINTSSGLTGYSPMPFLLSYGGSNPFNVSQLGSQQNFDSESNLYDFSLADFDGDGKLDVATANESSSNVSVFLNTSTSGVINFSKTLLTPGVNTFHVSTGDLNGDGKPEIVLSELNGSRLFVYKNNSTVGSPSFTSQVVTITGAKVSQVRIADLDLDGHLDLVITDQSASRFFVAVNQSSLATINFPVIKSFSLPGTTAVDGLAVGDLDGDGLSDIAVSEFQSPSGQIFILKNSSAPGAVSLDQSFTLTATTAVSNLKIGDLDGDSKPDLAVSALLASSVLIYGNQSNPAKIKFATPQVIPSNALPWGIEFGDVDGDGMTDIAVASVSQKLITVLNNTSTLGKFSFQTKNIPTTYINRFVRIGDLDNDGRPDLSFTSIDDNNNNILASKVSVFRNLNCVLPQLSPPGPLVICNTLTETLIASSSPGSTYEFFKDGVSMGAPSSTPYVNVNATGAYTVQLVNGACSNTSPSVSVTVAAGSAAAVTINPVTPVCVGGSLNLSVNNVGATDYIWTGPAFNTPAHGASVSSSNFQSNQAGQYTVTVIVGTCMTQQANIIVDVIDVPNVQVTYSGSSVVCGQPKVFSVYPSVSNYTYQWAEQGTGDIAGATGPTYSASASGNYFVKLKSTSNATCPTVVTSPKRVRVAAVPVVNFTMPAKACVNQSVDFINQSTVDADTTGLHLKYEWDFGDGNKSTQPNSSHAFTFASASESITLSVSYIGKSCLTPLMKSLQVQTAPTVAISNSSNNFSFCPSDSVLLQVIGTYDSYLWNTGKSTSSIYAKSSGTYSVDVALGACKVSASQVVTQYTIDAVASAIPNAVKKGGTSQLSVTGLNTFLWTPNKIGLSDSLIANPIVTPTASTLYTVKGKDFNGCLVEASVEVIIVQEDLFILSPDNNDGINDVWQIADSGKKCSVSIYDERGLKVYEADSYENDWKGLSSSGKMLPAGAYYFVMKCNSASGYTAGCINIIR